MDYYLSNYLSTYIPIFRVYEEGIWITIYPTIYHYSDRRSSNLDPWSQRDGSGQKPFLT